MLDIIFVFLFFSHLHFAVQFFLILSGMTCKINVYAGLEMCSLHNCLQSSRMKSRQPIFVPVQLWYRTHTFSAAMKYSNWPPPGYSLGRVLPQQVSSCYNNRLSLASSWHYCPGFVLLDLDRSPNMDTHSACVFCLHQQQVRILCQIFLVYSACTEEKGSMTLFGNSCSSIVISAPGL